MGWKQKLGADIRNARESANLTQRQLAKRVKISRQMVSRYEVGRDVPVVDVLARLALELDIKFEVEGVRVSFDQLSQRLRLRSVPKQLRLDFEKAQRFHRVVLDITPREGEIFITAKIPA